MKSLSWFALKRGHARRMATTARYAHLDNDPLRRASEAIAGRIAAALGEIEKPRDAISQARLRTGGLLRTRHLPGDRREDERY
jgi:hypothetical protein